MDKTKVLKLMEDFYQASYRNDRQAIYQLLSTTFKEKHHFDEFNRSRNYRDLDIGYLETILSIDEKENKINVKCVLKIRDKSVSHTYKVVEEGTAYKLVVDSFMFA